MTKSHTPFSAEALTDEQISEIWFDIAAADKHADSHRNRIDFARAILAANAPVAQPAGAVPLPLPKPFLVSVGGPLLELYTEKNMMEYAEERVTQALAASTHSPEPDLSERFGNARARLAANIPPVVSAEVRELAERVIREQSDPANQDIDQWERDLRESMTAPTHSPEPASWEKGRFHYQTLFNAITAATKPLDRHGVVISVKAFEEAMALAAPTHVPENSGGELVELLRSLRPEYGQVGSRDVDVADLQKRLDAAIAALCGTENSGGDRWISVEDRLPSSVGRVLVYRPNAHLKPACDPNIDVRMYQHKYFKGSHAVTHWMPLPAAPSPEPATRADGNFPT